MIESFREPAGLDEETAQKALKHYRKAYADEGGGLSSLYEGIPEVLDQLKSAGIPVAVPTSKVEDQAVLMEQRFGLERYFVNIFTRSGTGSLTARPPPVAQRAVRAQGPSVDIGRFTEYKLSAFPNRDWGEGEPTLSE